MPKARENPCRILSGYAHASRLPSSRPRNAARRPDASMYREGRAGPVSATGFAGIA